MNMLVTPRHGLEVVFKRCSRRRNIGAIGIGLCSTLLELNGRGLRVARGPRPSGEQQWPQTAKAGGEPAPDEETIHNDGIGGEEGKAGFEHTPVYYVRIKI